MKTKVNDVAILELYKNGTTNEQVTLETIFGREPFHKTKFDDLDEDEQSVLMAYHRLRKKAEEKRGKWTPNYDNDSQRKYYPYFEWKEGVGFVVLGTYSHWAGTRSYVGSRLVFPTEEMAIEFAKENIEDYKIILEQ